MPIRAYLLIEASAGKGNAILESLRELSVTVRADRVTGPYDVICVMESDSLDTLGEIVRELKDVFGEHRESRNIF